LFGNGGVVCGVAWNGSYWLAVGNNGDYSKSIAISSDGISWSWSVNSLGSSATGFSVAWNGSYWVFVGSNTDSSQYIATSSDGLHWTHSINNPSNIA
jgi:hypothetical protein